MTEVVCEGWDERMTEELEVTIPVYALYTSTLSIFSVGEFLFYIK